MTNMAGTSEIHIFKADIDPDQVVSVSTRELQDLFESGANWGESMNRTKEMNPWSTYAMAHELTCTNITDKDGGFLCSRCSWGDFGTIPRAVADTFKRCPNCGARLVRGAK